MQQIINEPAIDLVQPDHVMKYTPQYLPEYVSENLKRNGLQRVSEFMILSNRIFLRCILATLCTIGGIPGFVIAGILCLMSTLCTFYPILFIVTELNKKNSTIQSLKTLFETSKIRHKEATFAIDGRSENPTRYLPVHYNETAIVHIPVAFEIIFWIIFLLSFGALVVDYLIPTSIYYSILLRITPFLVGGIFSLIAFLPSLDLVYTITVLEHLVMYNQYGYTSNYEHQIDLV